MYRPKLGTWSGLGASGESQLHWSIQKRRPWPERGGMGRYRSGDAGDEPGGREGDIEWRTGAPA